MPESQYDVCLNLHTGADCALEERASLMLSFSPSVTQYGISYFSTFLHTATGRVEEEIEWFQARLFREPITTGTSLLGHWQQMPLSHEV